MSDGPEKIGTRRPPGRPPPGVSSFAFLLLVGLAVLGWTAWRLLSDPDSVSTDNAYVQGDLVVVTPQIAGTVASLHVDETRWVSAGDPLIALDVADASNALQHATAGLARTVREVRSLYRNGDALRAAVAMRISEVERAQAERIRAEEGYRRRASLHQRGAVSSEDLQNARAAYDSARGALSAAESAVTLAREQLEAQRVLIDGVALRRHPMIERAAAEMREAWFALHRTTIVAPVSGQVARRKVQIGQRVEAGANLMTLVPLDRVWVEANFKEVQMRDIRIGQPVRMFADLYGRSVVYAGKVAGLGAGTGASFSLLPAQNATGNWIKITQRVPVRIALDPGELKAHPLRVGLSMRVTVDIRDRDGPLLHDTGLHPAVGASGVEARLAQRADEAVAQVIDRHLGEPVARGAPASSGRR